LHAPGAMERKEYQLMVHIIEARGLTGLDEKTHVSDVLLLYKWDQFLG